MSLIHSQSGYKPRIYPYNGDVAPTQIDRAQSLDPTASLNRQKVEELGRDGVVTYIKKTPTTGCRLGQYEYGSLDFFRKICNKSAATTSVTLSDFKTSAFDICAYLLDDDATFKETLWYPKQRTSGFSINIGDPDALVERSFDFVGEDAKILQGNNKYYIYLAHTVETGEGGSYVEITIGSDDYTTYPVPVADPNHPTVYILRVLRVRSGVTTELVITTDYTYTDGTKKLRFLDADDFDVFKVYYSASSYISGASYFTNNDFDLGAIQANSCSLYIATTNYLHKIQSATIDVKFDREDLGEIGNADKILRGVKNKTVTINLGRKLDSRTIEEVLDGKAADWGIIDIRDFSANLTFIVAMYTDSDKGTFKLGLKATGMTPIDFKPASASIDNYVDTGNTLEGEALTITELVADLGI